MLPNGMLKRREWHEGPRTCSFPLQDVEALAFGLYISEVQSNPAPFLSILTHDKLMSKT